MPVESEKPADSRWGEIFLSWFAGQEIPMLERRLQFGGLDYFHFSSFFDLPGGRKAASFGSDPSRRLAAIKCAAEAVERRATGDFFLKNPIPKAFSNSNGWAVHASKEAAQAAAIEEAIERHLLLKSFFLYGWDGLLPLQEMQSQGITLQFLTSRFTAEGMIAGIVAAKSKFPGVSFGYTKGKISDLGTQKFWQSGIFEAVDGILCDSGDGAASEHSSWMRRERSRFLGEPFDFKILRKAADFSYQEADLGCFEVTDLDLSADYGLDFPLYAAFTRGGNLIPLFWKSELDEEALRYLSPILQRNGINEIPERHPIL